MPTSSQALILINTDGTTPQEFSRLNLTENRACPVSRVLLQGDDFSQQQSSRNSSRLDIGSSLSRSSPGIERDIYPTSTVKSYRSVFAFDPITRSFSWQLISDLSSNRVPSSTKRGLSRIFYRDKSKLDNNMASDEEMPLGRVPDAQTFENNIKRLMNLGFRSDHKIDTQDDITGQSPRRIGTSSYKKPNSDKKITDTPPILPSRLSSAPVISNESKSKSTEGFLNRPPRRMDSFVLNYKPVTKIVKSEERALYEEVKQQDAKKKKKKYIPTIRMRRELPPLNANMLCFNFYDGSLSHKDVKHLIESQCDSNILNLKFDPIYVHLGGATSQYKCMWVFSISDTKARAHLLYYGLKFNGERIRVRLYDDIMKEEHNAFNLYKEVEDEHADKHLKSNFVKKSFVSPSLCGFNSTNVLTTASEHTTHSTKQNDSKTKASNTRRRKREKRVNFFTL